MTTLRHIYDSVEGQNLDKRVSDWIYYRLHVTFDFIRIYCLGSSWKKPTRVAASTASAYVSEAEQRYIYIRTQTRPDHELKESFQKSMGETQLRPPWNQHYW